MWIKTQNNIYVNTEQLEALEFDSRLNSIYGHYRTDIRYVVLGEYVRPDDEKVKDIELAFFTALENNEVLFVMPR